MPVILIRKKGADTDILKNGDKLVQLLTDIFRKGCILLLVPHLNQGFYIPVLGHKTFHGIHSTF